MKKGFTMEKTLLLNDQIFTLSGFMRPEECTELIDQSLSNGYKPSPPSGGGHGRTGVRKTFAELFALLILFMASSA